MADIRAVSSALRKADGTSKQVPTDTVQNLSTPPNIYSAQLSSFSRLFSESERLDFSTATFRADQCSYFLVRDRRPGMIAFIARAANPKAS